MEPKKTALVVDDDEFLRPITCQIISNLGYKVLSAKDGKEGLYVAMNNPIDLLLTDFNMPGLNGVELHEQVVNQTKRAPYTIFLTGSVKQNKEVIDQYIHENGINDITQFLPKPTKLQNIQEAIAKFERFEEFAQAYNF